MFSLCSDCLLLSIGVCVGSTMYHMISVLPSQTVGRWHECPAGCGARHDWNGMDKLLPILDVTIALPPGWSTRVWGLSDVGDRSVVSCVGSILTVYHTGSVS